MRRTSSLQSIDEQVERHITSDKYQDVVTVAENILAVTTVANGLAAIPDMEVITSVGNNITAITAVNANLPTIETVNANMASIETVNSEVIPHIAEILLANDNAAIVTAEANAAEGFATDAEAYMNAAAASATNSSISETAAANSASSAASSALTSSDSASVATTKAEEAAVSSSSALTSANNAAASESNAAQSAIDAQDAVDSIIGLTASATTLSAGSSATAAYDDQTRVLTLGIPQGIQGLPGVDGHTITSITSNKVGKDTTVTVAGTFPSSPAVFHVLDGVDGFGAGDMLKSVYDSTDNGKVDVAEVAESVEWDNVANKPTVFIPSSHTHTTADITDFPALATVATSGSYEDLSDKPNVLAINDSVPSATEVYSSQRTQELHNAQQEAIASLSGASASFYSNVSQLVPESPTAAVDLVWTNNQASTNSDIFELGTNEIDFYKDGNYSFLNTLTFYRLSDGSNMDVAFEMYDADTLDVIGTTTQPIDITAGIKETVLFNSIVSISGATDVNPVRMKVRMQATSANGTLELFSFNSILVAQAIVDVVNTETDPVFTAWDKSTGISITKSQVSDFPILATVATSGSYNDLLDQPTFSSTLDGLTDVTVTTPTTGQVLTYNGTIWVNNDAGSSSVPIDETVSHLSTTAATYNADGTLATMTYTGGYKTLYTYSSGNLSTVQYTDTDGTTVLLTETYAYDGNGNLSTVTRS